MITYRPVTYKDIDQVRELYKLRPTIFDGYTDPDVKKYMFDSISTWFDNPWYYIPGIFVDGKLFGCLIAKEAETTPSWTWGHWISHPGYIKEMYNGDGFKTLRAADQMLFDEMEINRKLKRVFILFQVKDQDPQQNVKSIIWGHDRLFYWLKKWDFRLSKYQFFTDCIIEPGTIPKYPYQKALAMNRTWPIKVAIRMGMLSE
jgi:hypothetical protein